MSNWLDGGRVPAEIKLMILEYTSTGTHEDLVSLYEAYPEWVGGLWALFPNQLFPQALENVFASIEPMLITDVFRAYRIRKTRKYYADSLESSDETQEHRKWLQNGMRCILDSRIRRTGQTWTWHFPDFLSFDETLSDESNSDDSDLDDSNSVVSDSEVSNSGDSDYDGYDPEAAVSDDTSPLGRLPTTDVSVETIFGLGKVIEDFKYLTYRYSNEAFKKIRSIAEETGTGPSCATGLDDLPDVKLDLAQQYMFDRAFLKIEIYLLTRFWTNAQGERHRLHMGSSILRFIPHTPDFCHERPQFDSCLRYIFHAYRTYLKKTARELRVPELPTRDDFAWVRNLNEMHHAYEFEDYPPAATQNPIYTFAQRSISDEQSCLLWLCESGIGGLRQVHQATDTERRVEIMRRFSQRRTWETVALCHRFTRYDYCVDSQIGNIRPYPMQQRNRHPIMCLYPRRGCQKYFDTGSAWACASDFLVNDWSLRDAEGEDIISLNRQGHWITIADTDRGICDLNTFKRRGGSIQFDVPHGHPYMLTRRTHEYRPLSAPIPPFVIMTL